MVAGIDARGALDAIPTAKRPVLVGVSAHSWPSSVESTLAEEGLDFFEVLTDTDRTIRDAYGVFAKTPDIVFIDTERRIVHRAEGWSDGRDPKLARMVLARIAGEPVPMLLESDGYSGSDVCAVCHPDEAATWRFTAHAVAFDSLVVRGKDRDAECVGCHVAGYDEAGGYGIDAGQQHLENVGCENCHSAGGPHRPPAPGAADGNYAKVCVGCHDAKHSLGFDYTSFVEKVSHRAIAAATADERAAMLAGRGKPRDLLPATSPFVGSRACKACHQQEYALWAASAHARSLESLRDERRDDDADCVRCHVTGFGRPGGFRPDERAKRQPEFAHVGCESCHGPGGAHVADGADRKATIVALGDKCDSCVILQICGSCHDHDNDPEFPFQIERRIDAQRHGAR